MTVERTTAPLIFDQMPPKVSSKLPDWVILAFLVISAGFVFWFGQDAKRVEEVYSGNIYLKIAQSLRLLTGWLPISLGDIMYLILGWKLVTAIYRIIRAFFRKGEVNLVFYKYWLYVTTKNLLILYLLFQILWGLNYQRQGIAAQINIQLNEYNKADLLQLSDALTLHVNKLRPILGDSSFVFPTLQVLKDQVPEAYAIVAKQYGIPVYSNKSIKKSIYAYIGNYAGFSGYYNPFSGEAQLNQHIPPVLLPFVVCHEVAHQLGYASESEANFVGYLAATHSSEKALQYSAYFDLLLYTNNALFAEDSTLAIQQFKKLKASVRYDVKTYQNYLVQYQNPVEPYITQFYHQYLKWNNQAAGIRSYSKVIGWLIAYQKKYGKI